MPFFSIFGKRENRTPAKKQVTEQIAAEAFLRNVAYHVWHGWPHIISELDATFSSNTLSYKPADEHQAKVELFAVVLAYDLSAVVNLFPEEQGVRLTNLVSKALKNNDLGDFTWEVGLENPMPSVKIDSQLVYSRVLEYLPALLQMIHNKVRPDLSTELYDKWGLKPTPSEIGGESITYQDPLVLLALDAIAMSLIGYWKNVKENFDMVPS